jgi:type 2 lantibiotic biosynthesis protein LanM
VSGRDGSSGWFGIQLMPESGRFQFDPFGLSLYDGVAGIGLFFAAVEKILQLPEYRPDNYPTFREEALACAVPIRQAFKENGLQDFRTAPLGGATGSGSSIYVLLRMGKLLDEAALIEDALEAARRITPDMIEKDAGLDIMSGGAGLILSLLALYDETKDMPVLERAVVSGKVLLTKRMSTQKGYRVWKTVSDVPLAGFSHGAAGFAQALLRLYQASRDREFLDAADEAIAYENTLFSVEEQNWRDLREPDGESYMTAWCHGAAGIGMQRASSLNILDTPQIRQDIDAAITGIQHNFASSTNSADHLCCGNLGRIEAIFTMGRQLNRPDIVQYALQAASLFVERAAESGGYQYASYLPRGMFAAGFFQGGAGIGYELLRLTHPEFLPNVLIFE